MISQSERDRESYESRLKMRRDFSAALADAENKGGQIGRIASFQRLLRREITPREELQLLSLADLERLAARLEAEVKAKLGNGA